MPFETSLILSSHFGPIVFFCLQVEKELRQQEVMRERTRKADADKIRREAAAASTSSKARASKDLAQTARDSREGSSRVGQAEILAQAGVLGNRLGMAAEGAGETD